MEQHLRAHLTTCLACFAASRQLSTARVATLAAGDWRFFDRVGAGASFTVRKYDEVMGWFSANWPEGAEWPAGVPRPDTPTLAPEMADENENPAAKNLSDEVAA